MMKLSLRFLHYENKFYYRVALELGLIFALIISCSAVITGLSNQFQVLIQSNSGGPSEYILFQSGTSLDQSSIPLPLYDNISLNYLNYKIPFLVTPIIDQNNVSQYIYYTFIDQLVNTKTEFNIVNGTLPQNANEFIVGQAMSRDLGLNNTYPQKVLVNLPNNTKQQLVITGVFVDDGPWYYSFLGNLSYSINSLQNISFIDVQMKNNDEFSFFKQEVNTINKNNNLNDLISFAELKQTAALSNSFFNEILDLFNILIAFLFVLMALKLIHSSFNILNKLKYEYLITKIIGMDNARIQGIFLTKLLVSGNLGIALGVFLGTVFPELLSVIINPFFSTQKLTLVPNVFHIMVLVVIANIIFFFCSLSIYRLNIRDFKG